MSSNSNFVVALFARAAKLGQVKRRLAVDTGKQLALLTHQFLVEKTLHVLKDCTGAELQIWVDDVSDLQYEDPLFARRSRLIAQTGSSLGDRMANAIRHNLENANVPIVIGSDCPLMSANYIEKACAALEGDIDLVLGPAEDGGYVLIGMTRFHNDLFENINWGTDTVLAQTLAAANRLGLRVCLLEVLWDVDRVEDLEKLSALELPDYPGALKDFGQSMVRRYPEFV